MFVVALGYVYTLKSLGASIVPSSWPPGPHFYGRHIVGRRGKETLILRWLPVSRNILSIRLVTLANEFLMLLIDKNCRF